MFSRFALHERLNQAVSKLKFDQPTPVQEQAIPLALEGKDLLVSAETGSGKTAAYMLPTLHRLMSDKPRVMCARVLILVPTRELARQVYTHARRLASETPIRIAMIAGGHDIHHENAMIRKNPEIVIATPGRLLAHLERGTVDFSGLEVLILDEADRMLDMGFAEDVLKIAHSCNRDRQTLLFSATLDHRGVAGVAKHILRDPVAVTLSTGREGHSAIRQQKVLADDFVHKQRLLVWLLENEEYDKAVVFCKTKAQVDRLGGALAHGDLRTGRLHGDMDQFSRNRVMDLLRRGAVKVLVATDVAARGLDVKGVDLVVNFEMARSGDDYMHRIGRTGRAGEQGLAVSLVSDPEWNLTAGIERYLHQNFELRTLPGLAARYKGPKKLKSSGKAAGTTRAKKKSAENKAKPKKRLRDQKSKGNRRVATAVRAGGEEEGFAPLRKRKPAGDSD